MRPGKRLAVSVVVPAYNAAETLGDAIASLRAQTSPDWEAIVVDDGSTDDTAGIASLLAEEDPRVRVVTQSHQGASAARNVGISAAEHDWLLFLDADDWLAANHLEVMTGVLASNPGLDAVHCGSARIVSSGATVRTHFGPAAEDLFPDLARSCTFAIHACIVRRALVEAVGGFDSRLTTCEEWDLWQRIARCGARFGAIGQVLAFYRIRSGSATADTLRCLVDGFAVIRRGHGADPRVQTTGHAEGMPAEELPAALFAYLAYWASVVLGQGGDARPLLQYLRGEQEPALSVFALSATLFDCVPSAAGRPPEAWTELWSTVQPQLSDFLSELEAASGTPLLAARVHRQLERMILQASELTEDVTIGRSHAVRIDVRRPIADVVVPEGVERLYCLVAVGDHTLSWYAFPAFGVVAGETILEAVAPECTRYVLRNRLWTVVRSRYFWQALVGFLARRRTLRMILSIRRGSPRAWLGRWRGEIMRHLVSRNAVIRCEQPSEPARQAAVRLAAAIAAETGTVPQSAAGPPALGPVDADDRRDDGGDRGGACNRAAYWDQVFAMPDPWGYTTDYEQTKYRQTLAMLPAAPVEQALELACAEGHFTKQLAPRVGSLTAADISPLALARAKERCRGLENVAFLQLDLVRDRLPAHYDLIVCSEVLYYVETLPNLRAVARRLAAHLKEGGYLLMAHARVLTDEPDQPGFDWGHSFGTKAIGEVFAECPLLSLVKEFRTPLYRIHLFQRAPDGSWSRRPPQIIESTEIGRLSAEAAALARWGSGAKEPVKIMTGRLPILMYRRIASDGPPELSRYRVSPEQFREHLAYLRSSGYHDLSLERWSEFIAARRGPPERAVIITFDDGYRDFKTEAAPILWYYGFSAIVFLVVGQVGRAAAWDSIYGTPLPLLTWDEARDLEQGGIRFGSHFLRHVPLTGLPLETVVREGARAWAILQRELRQPVPAIAYPHGDYDPVVAQALRASGYEYGLTCRHGPSGLSDRLMELPRIEVAGTDDIQTFVAKLESAAGPSAPRPAAR